MTCSFIEALISSFEFISHQTNETLYVNTNFVGNQS